MPKVEVSAELGDKIVTREHGRRLRELIETHLGTEPVTIDFGALQITSVSFFDEAFGQLALRYGEDLLRMVKFDRIDPFDMALVQDIIRSRAREAKKRASR